MTLTSCLREKLLITMWALDISSQKDLAGALYRIDERAPSELKVKDKKTWDTALQRIYKYFGTTQTDDTDLIDRILVCLGMTMPAVRTMTCTPIEFFAALPDDSKATARLNGGPKLEAILQIPEPEPTAEPDLIEPEAPEGEDVSLAVQAGVHSRRFARGLHIVHIDRDYPDHDIRKAIRAGTLDQKYLYFDRYSARNWRRLTRAISRYPTYRYCCDTLVTFLSSSAWPELLDAGKIARVYMLGAGAPDKDVAILDSFTLRSSYGPAHQLDYVMVDTSVNMILETIKEIDELTHEDTGHPSYNSFLSLVTVVADFMNLRQINNKLLRDQVITRRDAENSAYFIPGGTISNIDEEQFIRSCLALQPGDLLIIGIEFMEPGDVEVFRSKLKARYDHETLRKLVIPPIRSILDEQRIDILKDDGKGIIDVQVVDRPPTRHFSKALTVTIQALIEPEPIRLATASRLDRDEFVRFVEGSGFKLLNLFPHISEPSYNQAVFVRLSR